MSKLKDHLFYTGQYKSARKLLLKHETPEKVAMMSDDQICKELEKHYTLVTGTDEDLLLIKKEDMEKFNELTVWLSR